MASPLVDLLAVIGLLALIVPMLYFAWLGVEREVHSPGYRSHEEDDTTTAES